MRVLLRALLRDLRARRGHLIVAATMLASAVLVSAQQQAGPSASAEKPAPEYKDIDTFFRSLPVVQAHQLDASQALWLVTMPLACLDRPQAQPAGRPYLWIATYKPVNDYQRTRAFYGCFDWHSAVNSIWTIVRIAKTYPDLPLGHLMRAKLNEHLGKTNVEGELAYFKDAGQFERPYGYAWLLKLYAEILTWKDPDAQKWAANLAPMAQWFSEQMVQFLKDLPQPNRGGVHPNTSFAMHLMLDYVEATNDTALKTAIVDNAKRFYTDDKNCQTAIEPAGSDFLSPCLTEAAVMSRVMERAAFQRWLDGFLPPLYSTSFRPLTIPVDTAGITRPDRLAGKSHLIGLAFQRGAVMNRLADVLPSGDKRIAVFRRLAAIHGEKGMQGMYDAGYFGSHWLGTYAVYYMLSPQMLATKD